MAVIEWTNNVWHGHGPAMKGSGRVDIWRNSERDTIVYFNGWASNDRVYSDGFYGYNVTAYLEVDGIRIQDVQVTSASYSGTGYFSGSFSWGSSSGTIKIHYVCGQPGGCSKGYPDVVVGQCGVPAYNPEVPATNPTSGAVYNQNSVVNGNEKLDWKFKCSWSGEAGGTHSISYYNIDIFYNKARGQNNNNSPDGYIERYTKNSWVNIDSSNHLFPKCKAGETLYFFVRLRIDNAYWLDRYYLGALKLYKDGYIFYKNSNGSKVEANMAYYKNSSGNKQKARYALVKDSNGTKRIIDIYTTHYE